MKVFKCLILSDQSSKTPKYSVNADIKEKKSETFETEMIILDSTFQLRFVSGFFLKTFSTWTDRLTWGGQTWRRCRWNEITDDDLLRAPFGWKTFTPLFLLTSWNTFMSWFSASSFARDGGGRGLSLFKQGDDLSLFHWTDVC